MQITITLYCPDCQSTKIKKNGPPKFGKQNFLCKDCGRQFIGDHALTYKDCHSSIIQKNLLMLVRGIGIRDISVIEKVSIKKVLSVLVNSNKIITPKQ
jgi:transposase-like protein